MQLVPIAPCPLCVEREHPSSPLWLPLRYGSLAMRSWTNFLHEETQLLQSFFTGQAVIPLLGLARLSLAKCNFVCPSKVLAALDGYLGTSLWSVLIFFWYLSTSKSSLLSQGGSPALLSPSPFVVVGLFRSYSQLL